LAIQWSELRFCVPTADEKYRDAPYSLTFPFLQSAALEPFLVMDRSKDETSRIREFVQWLEQQHG